MGDTAGIHTRSREAAIRYGAEMPASRITVNTPTTHGAIGFSTALPPSMTLGCGSWGGNVTSDNVSPLHLLDIKRVAFETRPVKSTRPAVSVSTAAVPGPSPAPATTPRPAHSGGGSGARQINREEIAAIVDRFLATRPPEETPEAAPRQTDERPQQTSRPVEAEAGSMYAGPSQSGRQGEVRAAANGGRLSSSADAAKASATAAN